MGRMEWEQVLQNASGSLSMNHWIGLNTINTVRKVSSALLALGSNRAALSE